MAIITTLEKLEQIAYNDNIFIYNFHISDTKKSSCLNFRGMKAISLDKPLITSKAEETELLAEELGHFKTGSLYPLKKSYNSTVEKQNRAICEARAKKWAFKKILPPYLILKGIEAGITDYYELADYCNVTVEFFTKAIEYYKTQDIVFYSVTL